jgi:hypothetical protein
VNLRASRGKLTRPLAARPLRLLAQVGHWHQYTRYPPIDSRGGKVVADYASMSADNKTSVPNGADTRTSHAACRLRLPHSYPPSTAGTPTLSTLRSSSRARLATCESAPQPRMHAHALLVRLHARAHARSLTSTCAAHATGDASSEVNPDHCQEEWQIQNLCSGNYGRYESLRARMRLRTQPLTCGPRPPGYGYFQVHNASVATWFWNTTVPVRGSNNPAFSDSLTIVKTA